MTIPQYLIVNGPSKWDLAYNFFKPMGKRQDIQFTIEPHVSPLILEKKDEQILPLYIISMELADNIGEKFLIKGIARLIQSKPAQTQRFTGQYDIRSRQGWLNFEPAT